MFNRDRIDISRKIYSKLELKDPLEAFNQTLSVQKFRKENFFIIFYRV